MTAAYQDIKYIVLYCECHFTSLHSCWCYGEWSPNSGEPVGHHSSTCHDCTYLRALSLPALTFGTSCSCVWPRGGCSRTADVKTYVCDKLWLTVILVSRQYIVMLRWTRLLGSASHLLVVSDERDWRKKNKQLYSPIKTWLESESRNYACRCNIYAKSRVFVDSQDIRNLIRPNWYVCRRWFSSISDVVQLCKKCDSFTVWQSRTADCTFE